MTAATPDSGPSFFSSLSIHGSNGRHEAFAFSLLGQAAVLGIIIYFTSCVIRTPAPELVHRVASLDLPLIFSGKNGGGGGGRDSLPASRGDLPRASLDPQIVPPTVVVPKKCQSYQWTRPS